MKQYEKYRGIHPGFVLERELKKRSIKQRPFALLLDEYPQTFNAIIKGKRSIPTPLALKIEQQLSLEEGTLVLLQAYYDIQKAKKKITPDLTVLNKSLFWDTDINCIDWIGQYQAVIWRVFERGNETEKEEIIHFYGKEKVEAVLGKTDSRVPYTIYRNDH